MDAVALPPAPGTDGKANQLRNAGCFLSGVRLAIVPPSHAPMSSIAALPLATRPAELFGPTWPGVARKSGWNGWVARNVLRSLPALTKQGSSNFCLVAASFSTADEHSLSVKLYHQWAAGHLSPAPRATGILLIALILAMSAFSSSIVVGVVVMPAWVNMSLLYQKPSIPNWYGRPYCLPLTDQMLDAAPIAATWSLVWSVMSLR